MPRARCCRDCGDGADCALLVVLARMILWSDTFYSNDYVTRHANDRCSLLIGTAGRSLPEDDTPFSAQEDTALILVNV